MNVTPDDKVLRVLYITHPDTGNDAAAFAGLRAMEPGLHVKLVHGVSDALAEVRTDATYRALFMGQPCLTTKPWRSSRAFAATAPLSPSWSWSPIRTASFSCPPSRQAQTTRW